MYTIYYDLKYYFLKFNKYSNSILFLICALYFCYVKSINVVAVDRVSPNPYWLSSKHYILSIKKEKSQSINVLWFQNIEMQSTWIPQQLLCNKLNQGSPLQGRCPSRGQGEIFSSSAKFVLLARVTFSCVYSIVQLVNYSCSSQLTASFKLISISTEM